jgi:hypothetical protein
MDVPEVAETDGGAAEPQASKTQASTAVTPDENGDPSVSGPHPCQERDCDEDADASTGYTYCEDHANLKGEAPEEGALEEPDPDAGGEEAEPDVLEADLSEDDFGGGGDLFSDVEEAGDPDDLDGEDGEEDPLDALDSRGESLEEAFNEGFGRLGVAGLPDDDERDDLEDEIAEIAGAFRFGYFGAQVMEEYVFAPDDEQVDPAWGFAGSALCLAAVVLWLRPDGDEQMAKLQSAVSNLAGGAV